MIVINTGATANDGLGDKLRDAFIIVNQNFLDIQDILDVVLTDSSIISISQISGLQTILDDLSYQVSLIPGLQDDINSINSIIYTINQTLNSQNGSISDLYSLINDLQQQIYTKIGDAPIDGEQYVRQNGEWVIASGGDTNYVPYTGATQSVDLGIYGLTAGSLQFTGLTNSGRMTWNDSDGTMDLTLKGGNVTLQIGQEQLVRVVNKTATNITLQESAYQAVRVTGAQGQRLKVDLAQATNDLLSAETIGLVTETILNNQEGFVTISGLVNKINTTGSLQSETWNDGDILYLSPTVAGRITNIKPVAPNHLVIIGYVVYSHAVNGKIFVKVDNGYELDELHNVKITGATAGQVLSYTGTLWENKYLTQVSNLRRHSFTNFDGTNSYDYNGYAPTGSSESSNVWTITRLTINAFGSTIKGTASNVAWTNRASVIYT